MELELELLLQIQLAPRSTGSTRETATKKPWGARPTAFSTS